MSKNSNGGKPDFKLTPLQDRFVDWYIITLNRTEAARKAGYKGDDNALAVIGHRNLRNAKIRAAITARMEELTMPKAEILMRLEQEASADISWFFEVKGGKVQIKESAFKKFGHLIKSIRQTKDGIHLALYDSQKAKELLAKHYGMLTDNIKIEEVRTKGYIGISPDDWDDNTPEDISNV